eukprot:INCI1575.2.p1 GENE.INCI1575.2~~INCI1575.2.p1  ORF type:complete len:1087 (-),score=208.12 INCI1575.2:728-3706(-)
MTREVFHVMYESGEIFWHRLANFKLRFRKTWHEQHIADVVAALSAVGEKTTFPLEVPTRTHSQLLEAQQQRIFAHRGHAGSTLPSVYFGVAWKNIGCTEKYSTPVGAGHWTSTLVFRGLCISIGTFQSEIEAALHYNDTLNQFFKGTELELARNVILTSNVASEASPSESNPLRKFSRHFRSCLHIPPDIVATGYTMNHSDTPCIISRAKQLAGFRVADLPKHHYMTSIEPRHVGAQLDSWVLNQRQSNFQQDSSSSAAQENVPFKPGTAVEVRYQRGIGWFSAVVCAVLMDADKEELSYTVEFEDGERETGVVPPYIRVIRAGDSNDELPKVRTTRTSRKAPHATTNIEHNLTQAHASIAHGPSRSVATTSGGDGTASKSQSKSAATLLPTTWSHEQRESLYRGAEVEFLSRRAPHRSIRGRFTALISGGKSACWDRWQFELEMGTVEYVDEDVAHALMGSWIRCRRDWLRRIETDDLSSRFFSSPPLRGSLESSWVQNFFAGDEMARAISAADEERAVQLKHGEAAQAFENAKTVALNAKWTSLRAVSKAQAAHAVATVAVRAQRAEFSKQQDLFDAAVDAVNESREKYRLAEETHKKAVATSKLATQKLELHGQVVEKTIREVASKSNEGQHEAPNASSESRHGVQRGFFEMASAVNRVATAVGTPASGRRRTRRSYAGIKLEWGKSIDSDNCLVAVTTADEEKLKKASQMQEQLALAATKSREAEMAAKHNCVAAEKALERAISAKEVEANKTLAAQNSLVDSIASMKDTEETLRAVVVNSSNVRRQGEPVKLMSARAVAALSAAIRTSLGTGISEGDDVLRPVVEDRHRPLDSVERYAWFVTHHTIARRKMHLKITMSGRVRDKDNHTLYQCGGQRQTRTYGEVLPPFVHRIVVHLRKMFGNNLCGRYIYDLGSGLGHVLAQLAYETDAVVVGVEREIVLHHRSREYLAQMRKFFQAQVARDRIQVRESVFEYAHDVHTVLLLRALG